MCKDNTDKDAVSVQILQQIVTPQPGDMFSTRCGKCMEISETERKDLANGILLCAFCILFAFALWLTYGIATDTLGSAPQISPLPRRIDLK
nr:hypothetical transcript [Hymenolepis microstoma]